MVDTLASSVHRRAQHALKTSPIHALRELHVEQIGQSLILSGRVDTFYHKQLAQELIRSFVDGFDLVNSICVDYDRLSSDESTWPS